MTPNRRPGSPSSWESLPSLSANSSAPILPPLVRWTHSHTHSPYNVLFLSYPCNHAAPLARRGLCVRMLHIFQSHMIASLPCRSVLQEAVRSFQLRDGAELTQSALVLPPPARGVNTRTQLDSIAPLSPLVHLDHSLFSLHVAVFIVFFSVQRCSGVGERCVSRGRSNDHTHLALRESTSACCARGAYNATVRSDLKNYRSDMLLQPPCSTGFVPRRLGDVRMYSPPSRLGTRPPFYATQIMLMRLCKSVSCECVKVFQGQVSTA